MYVYVCEYIIILLSEGVLLCKVSHLSGGNKRRTLIPPPIMLMLLEVLLSFFLLKLIHYSPVE